MTRILIIGGGPIGELLAARLADQYDGVAFADEDERAVKRARDRGTDAHAVALDEPASLSAVVEETPKLAVIATSRDSRNLLVAQWLRTYFDAKRIFALVNNPQYHDAFEDTAIRTICVTAALSRAVVAAADPSSGSEVRRSVDRDGRLADGSTRS